VTPPALRYLSAADVVAAMPALDERLRLAEKTLVGLADGSAELPAKLGVHPRVGSSFGHAMPAYLRGTDPDGAEDLLGLKWVVGFPGNSAHGLPTIAATVILSDPATGLPMAILDGGPITAARTAAISGVAIRRFAPGDRADGAGGRRRVALLGAGVQGHSHIPMIGHVLPGAQVAIFDRHPDRAAALARVALRTEGIGTATVAPDAQRAVDGADVVITAVSFGPVHQIMTDDWLVPDALVVPVDYATTCAAEVARDAGLFLVDELGQFLANRAAGLFDGYPDPTATLGEAILDGTTRPEAGRVVITHLGTGLADLIFAAAIVRAATETGLGTVLA
jgi:ornithine cyclodeaminase/alanine dehydrogenase-like protein (mu-crystallin family)